ncbi:MAG TPA: hypothetical protein PKM65_20490 [Spirochaetota bacterium]|nr:hypothetical protein [Spirochaetota bacterium]
MEEQELRQEIEPVIGEAGALVVDNKESFERASRFILELDGLAKKIKAYWFEPKKRAWETHKALVAKETEMLKPVEERRGALASKVKAYLTEQDRIRREEQRKLDEERRKAEEAERKKLEKKAEKAEAKGDAEKAEELRQKAEDVYVPPAVVAPEVEKTTRTETGTVSQRKDVEIKVVDVKAVLDLVVKGELPIGIVTISESKLKQHVKLMQLDRLAGCEIKEVIIASYRGK